MKMEFIEYSIRFLVGGLLVLVITVIAEKYQHPYIGALLLFFPAITIASVYFIGSSAGNDAAARFILGGLSAIPVWVIYAISIYLLLRNTSLIPAIFWSFIVWLIGAGIFVYIKVSYLH